MPIVDTANVFRKVLPALPAVTILFLIYLFSQRRQAENGRRVAFFRRLKGFRLIKFPRFHEYLGHAPQGLFAFLLLFGIGVVVVFVLLGSVCHGGGDTITVVATVRECYVEEVESK